VTSAGVKTGFFFDQDLDPGTWGSKVARCGFRTGPHYPGDVSLSILVYRWSNLRNLGVPHVSKKVIGHASLETQGKSAVSTTNKRPCMATYRFVGGLPYFDAHAKRQDLGLGSMRKPENRFTDAYAQMRESNDGVVGVVTQRWSGSWRGLR
jgi:hypothetical protein